MLYFAYGSNMDPAQMAKRCPGARAVGSAVLRGHRLAFTYDSGFWRGGVATVLSDESDEVCGVLWEITLAHEAELDRYEGVATGVYVKRSMAIRYGAREVAALVYVATDTRERLPSARYMRGLIRGARAHALPPTYIDRLVAVEVRGGSRRDRTTR